MSYLNSEAPAPHENDCPDPFSLPRQVFRTTEEALAASKNLIARFADDPELDRRRREGKRITVPFEM
jgi:hypothetical protein